MYKLSVIIPVYNTEAFLAECIDSVVRQTVFGSMQILLVNDGSADGSGRICDEFAARYENIVVIHKENGGVSTARNAGLDAAQGEYVGFIDSDDTIAEDYYEKLLAAAEQNGCDMAYGGMTFVRAEGRRECDCGIESGTVTRREDIGDFFVRRMLSDGRHNSVWAKIFRRDVVEAGKLRFPIGVKIAEDKRFVLEFLQRCEAIVCAGGCGYFYRDVDSSAMHSGNKMELLIAENEVEIELFLSFGLDENTVREERGYFLFIELVDFFGREYERGKDFAREAINRLYSNSELTKAIDAALGYVAANSGRVHRLYARAVGRCSVGLTMLALYISRKINLRGA